MNKYLRGVPLQRGTVKMAYDHAPRSASKVQSYAETGLKVVQLAAAVLGIVHAGALMFSRRNDQAISFEEDAELVVQDEVIQGPPPAMSARGRLF